MIELGDQLVWEHAKERLNIHFDVAKDWLLSLGLAEHVSVDMNGQHGAVVADLSRPIFGHGWDEHFDIVTDIGTLEHVMPLDGQYHALANMHRWCKPGGLMLHQLPPRGHWLDHCRFRYDERFIETLAELNGYEIVNMERTKLPTLNPTVEYLSAALRRGPDSQFYSSAQPYFTFDKKRLVETIECS